MKQKKTKREEKWIDKIDVDEKLKRGVKTNRIKQIKDDFGSSSTIHMVHNISVLHLPVFKTRKSYTMELFYRIYTAVDI